MNIFVTDRDPVKSAINLDDKRVKHMPKECIELLGIYAHAVTGVWYIDFPLWDADKRNEPQFLYNHPVSRWVRKDKANMTWLLKHTIALFDEHEYRFGVPNPYQEIFIKLRPVLGSTVQHEPKGFHNSSLFKDIYVIDAYRRTMKVKWFETDKIKPVRWTNRQVPSWAFEQTNLEL